MSRDILFRTGDLTFSYRVGGVLIQDGKILLQRPEHDDYAIIGGHVSGMETSAEALRREFEEELHADIEVLDLLAVGEVFFSWSGRPCHQVCLYYSVRLLGGGIPLTGEFHGYDELGGERIGLDYCWVPLERLRDGVKVYPLELIPHILEPKREAVHFISKEFES